MFGRTEKNWAPQLGSADQSDKMNDEQEDADDDVDDVEGEGKGREGRRREVSLLMANCNAANKQTNVHTLFECAFEMEMEIEIESNAHSE